MFSKLKQYQDLRSQAKVIQNTLTQEMITVNKKGIKVVINGNMEITSIKIENTAARETLEANLTYAVNEAIKEIQKVIATKMRSMGDISSMLKF
jgi:DNA-binding protein YbaB